MDGIAEMVPEEAIRRRERYRGKVIAFVHAKGSSERVPSKNMRILGDMPLFCHAVRHAREAGLVDEVVVDSDSDEILEIGERQGAIALKRPGRLATNLATGDDLAYWQAANFPMSRIVVQVVPTAPFLKPETVDRAIRMLLDDPDLDSVAGVCEEALYLWKDGRPAYYREDGTIPNSFELCKAVYETTGLYVNQTGAVLRTHRRLNPESCRPCPVGKMEAVDINTPEDFEFAEALWRGTSARDAKSRAW